MQPTLVTDALRTLVSELFDGAPEAMSWIITPGDAGIISWLRALDPAHASAHPLPDRPSIAAHAGHLRFHLELLNRWSVGEPSFETADWKTSWSHQTVNREEWTSLVDELERRAHAWREALAEEREWDPVEMTGSIASVAHMAYHFGALRQLRELAAVAADEQSVAR